MVRNSSVPRRLDVADPVTARCAPRALIAPAGMWVSAHRMRAEDGMQAERRGKPVTDTTVLITQLRKLHELTDAEIQVAGTRRSQASTESLAVELGQHADTARGRADALERALRERGGGPALVGPLGGRTTAAVRELVDQCRPFAEALLGDVALEYQLVDRSRYLRALAAVAQDRALVRLADQLITAHTATVDWLMRVLAEEALGGPAALTRTPSQPVAGAAVRLMNASVAWPARGVDRAMEAARWTERRIGRLFGRGAQAGEVAANSIAEGRDAAVERGEVGAQGPDELPIDGYGDMNVATAAAAIKELRAPADVRTIVAHEASHKDRRGVHSAAESQLASIAQEAAGIR